MTSSATPPTCPQVEKIKIFLLNCLVVVFSCSKWRTNWTRRPQNFPIQVPLFVSRKAQLRTLAEKQLTLNAKVLIANGEKHPRQKLMV